MENKRNVIFYNHPYTENKSKDFPIYIDSNNIVQFVYPEFELDYSDLCHMYLSTDEITVCIMDVGPGGMFDPPDCHPGDETYYVLEGTITILNPATGQCIEVKAGESLLIPKGALHSGYNFGEKAVKVLAILAPKVKEEPGFETDLTGPKKTFKYNSADFNGISKEWDAPQLYGNIDSLGTWPVPGPELRDTGIIYHISEEKKLRVINGNARPILMKFAVSNDFMHVGEYILPTGGVVTSHSEVISHGGKALLFGIDGPITVFILKTKEVYILKHYEGLYIPPNTEYQLINYSNTTAKAIFAIAKDL